MQQMTKERPILFSGSMVKAILEGRKTHTRRIVKPQPANIIPFIGADNNPTHEFGACYEYPTVINKHVCCPYGQPGDRLWVREAFGSKIRSVGGTPHESIAYRATEPDAAYCYDCNGNELPMKWKPSIHMPRKYCRILLEIVSVRVERLNSISADDCRKEGCDGGHGAIPGYLYSALPQEHFRHLWRDINGDESWDLNPWVWVVEFKRVTQEVA